MKYPINFIFEVSWEVCNKVGGINTVIKSKVPQMLKHYHDNYFLIGPYIQKKAVIEFQEKVPFDFLHDVFSALNKEGIVCRYGKWLTEGEPNTILVDYTGYKYKNNEIKAKLWESFKIDSLGTDFYDFDEPILWSTAVGCFLEKFARNFKDKKIVAHFHEWLSCGALLYLKRNNVKLPTIFTTHATVVGRTLAGNNFDLYGKLPDIDADKEAYNLKVHSKHQVEKISAHVCDVFTTISEILALETKFILGRDPDILIYNGLDFSRYPTIEEISLKHRLYRERIREFLRYYFFPYYSFDLDNTLIYFISGRYEFHNKGIDLLIQALAKLNKKLKEENSKKTIVVFFLIPKEVIRIKPEISQARAYYEDFRSLVDENLSDIRSRVVDSILSKKQISEKTLFSKEFIFEAKRRAFRFFKDGLPYLCTHDIHNEESDLILKALRENELLNRRDDKVKVIFYPTYLTGADSLLDLSYNEFILGSHLGIFPSYYEPWGYTPLETAALGVAAVTTDFSGFGRYLLKLNEGKKGIFVIEMFNRPVDKKIENLFQVMYNFCKLTREERVRNKLEAQKLSKLVDWEVLIEGYIKAHNLAVERVYK
ncbi:MAG: hypothetical protein QXY62_04815 [Candidatus Altiarchaeota archaeon]